MKKKKKIKMSSAEIFTQNAYSYAPFFCPMGVSLHEYNFLRYIIIQIFKL